MKIIFLVIILFTATQTLIAQETKTTPARLFPIEQRGKHGYIDSTGQVVVKPKFDEAWRFSEGLAPVLINDKWGYVDEAGKLVMKPQFFDARPFYEGLALVGVFFKAGSRNGRIGNYGYIDKTGQLVIAPQFGVAFDFSDGLSRIQTEDYKNGYIDKTGRVVFWDERLTEDFSNGLALFKTNSNMTDSMTGYLDKTGRVAIGARFDWGESFAEGLACVALNKQAGFIDTKGDVAIEFGFDACRSFSEGLAAVMVGNKWGYVDKSGQMIIEPQFAEAAQFSDDVAVVRVFENAGAPGKEQRLKEGERIISLKPGKFAVIDKTGRMILAPKFVQIGDFYGGLAVVNLGEDYIVHGDFDKWGYINKAGKYVWKSFVNKRRSGGY
jgi:hypothetical protein